jgi:hypothetical protein
MPRRQLAEAIIAARQKIVTGAGTMVEMALRYAGYPSTISSSWTTNAKPRWSAICSWCCARSAKRSR